MVVEIKPIQSKLNDCFLPWSLCVFGNSIFTSPILHRVVHSAYMSSSDKGKRLVTARCTVHSARCTVHTRVSGAKCYCAVIQVKMRSTLCTVEYESGDFRWLGWCVSLSCDSSSCSSGHIISTQVAWLHSSPSAVFESAEERRHQKASGL